MLIIPLFAMAINKQVHAYSGIVYSYVKKNRVFLCMYLNGEIFK